MGEYYLKLTKVGDGNFFANLPVNDTNLNLFFKKTNLIVFIFILNHILRF